MKKDINFKAHTPYEPAGDQPTAIKELPIRSLHAQRVSYLVSVKTICY